jgi:hypothetical protein
LEGLVTTRGSQYWIRRAVEQQGLLNGAISSRLGQVRAAEIEWLSPRPPKYPEFRDGRAFTEVGIPALAKRSLADFWPPRGPVWDALGRAGSDFLLVEAKAHVSELASPASQAKPQSLVRIMGTLAEVRRFYAPESRANWAGAFYQYANRLATLYLLRKVNRVRAHLIFVYFLNAKDVKGPGTIPEWEAALTVMHAALGLPRRHRLGRYVHKCFINVEDLESGRA